MWQPQGDWILSLSKEYRPPPHKPGMEAPCCLPPGRQQRAHVDLDKERIKAHTMGKKNLPRCSVESEVPTGLHGILG